MSLMLNTGAMQYRTDAQSAWQPLVLMANVDLASLADRFSTSSTYEVGEYVLYDGAMYRCITAVTTAGAWDSSKWVEVVIGMETKLWSIVRLGWNLRFRNRLKQKVSEYGEPFYVPGFGKNGGSTFGGTVNLTFDIGKTAKKNIGK